MALPDKLPVILLDWYGRVARSLPWREDKEPYHVWLSEIMLQQTRAEVVKGYYTRFLAEIPTVEALAVAGEQRLFKLWEGLGYYSRVRNLQKAAKMIVSDFRGKFPDTYSELRKLPGVGPYTAGAVASICFDEPVPAVDGNVLRVISRLTGLQDITEQFKHLVAASLTSIYPKNRSGDFTQSLMELGATVCLPSGLPKCGECPVSGLCSAYKNNNVQPYRKSRKSKRVVELTLFILSRDGLLAVRKREKNGLLAGMWEFPNTEGALNETAAYELLSAWGVKPVAIIKAVRRVHLFTHIRWNMTCYYFECAATPERFIWADRTALHSIYALPTAFRMFLD